MLQASPTRFNLTMSLSECLHFEKQQAGLCGVHCLNTLLQGEYFTEVDLAEIGRTLDALEKDAMAEMGTETTDFVKFVGEDSGNVNDSGYFSVQVLAKALDVWELKIISLNSEDGRSARDAPLNEVAFICNHEDHWFTIRRFGSNKIWFNLNSLSRGPELVTQTYLSLFLETLRQEGYTIFTVRGNFPPCAGDEVYSAYAPSHRQEAASAQSEEDDMARAIAASLEQPQDPANTGQRLGGSSTVSRLVGGDPKGGNTQPQGGDSDDDEDLKAALAMSLQQQ